MLFGLESGLQIGKVKFTVLPIKEDLKFYKTA